MNVAELNILRDKLQRAMNHVEDMTRALLVPRAGMQPDAYSTVGLLTQGLTLEESLDDVEALDPIEVSAWAVVQRFWAVRVPVADSNGDIEGYEIMRFPTEAEARAYVAAAETQGGA